MRTRIATAAVILTAIMLLGTGNVFTNAQTGTGPHPLGEFFQFDVERTRSESSDSFGEFYNGSMDLVHSTSEQRSNTMDSTGTVSVTFLGPENNELIHQYWVPKDGPQDPGPGGPVVDQMPPPPLPEVFIQITNAEDQSGSVNESYVEWDAMEGTTRNDSFAFDWGPQYEERTFIDHTFFNETYGAIFDEMLAPVGASEQWFYMDFLGYDVPGTVNVSRSIENGMGYFFVNGVNQSYSTVTVITIMEIDVEINETVDLVLGPPDDPNAPVITAPVTGNISGVMISEFTYNTVDGMLLGWYKYKGSEASVIVEGTGEVYFPPPPDSPEPGFTDNVTIYSQGYYNVDEMEYGDIISFGPAPVSTQNTWFSEGDTLGFDSIVEFNGSWYFEGGDNFNTHWERHFMTGSGTGYTQLQVMMVQPDFISAFVYGETTVEVRSEQSSSESAPITDSWVETNSFFNYEAYLPTATDKELVWEVDQFYTPEDGNAPFSLPLTSQETYFDTMDLSINGFLFNDLEVEVLHLTYSMTYDGPEDQFYGPPPPGGTLSLSQEPGPAPAHLVVDNVVELFIYWDTNTGAFLGFEEVDSSYMMREMSNVDPNTGAVVDYWKEEMSFELFNQMLLSSHPTLYQEAPPTSSTSDNVTETNQTTTTPTDTNSTAGNDTGVAPPSNPLPGFEFAVVSTAFIGIMVIRRRQK